METGYPEGFAFTPDTQSGVPVSHSCEPTQMSLSPLTLFPSLPFQTRDYWWCEVSLMIRP